MSSLELVRTPAFVRKYIKWMVIFFFLLPFIALFLPWQQNVTATGKVTAFSASERVQTIDAPVSGMIVKWHVQEGSVVKEGDLLLEISDVDQNFQQRLSSLRDNQENKLEAKSNELKSYELQLKNLISSRDAKISAAQFKLDVANQKIRSSSESVSSAQAVLATADAQIRRFRRLYSDGLVSKRDTEVAERDHIIAERNLNSARAQLASAHAEAKSATVEIQEIRADTQASLASSQGSVNKIRGELADSQNSLTRSEINLSRQQMQRVVAPRSGTIFRLPVNTQSQIIKQGDQLLIIVPDTANSSVELWVDGRDAPLISAGEEVRLEFEGWPAILVPGWANVGVGTFQGEVAFVDPTDNGSGLFRVMVIPKKDGYEWPSAQFLRQGVSAKGWILLQKVSIGYEIWRLLNGFPPRIDHIPDVTNAGGKS